MGIASLSQSYFMPIGHSVPVSEPAGWIAGIIGGYIGAELGKQAVDAIFADASPGVRDAARVLAAGMGAGIGHFAAGGATRAVINTITGDVGVGYGVSAVSTPVCSAGHGVYEMVREAGEVAAKKTLTAALDVARSKKY